MERPNLLDDGNGQLSDGYNGFVQPTIEAGKRGAGDLSASTLEDEFAEYTEETETKE